MCYRFDSSTGKLLQWLCKGNFATFKCIPIFDSNFIQVSRRGEVSDVHNSVQMVTVGIAYPAPTSRCLLLRCWHDQERGLKSEKGCLL